MKRYSEYIVRYWNDDSIDFREEIVRCGDCLEYHPELYKHISCERLGRYVEPDFYCAYGKREERIEQ